MFLSIIVIIIYNKWITKTTQQQLYSDVDLIPKRKVGLVLGASKTNSNGRDNLYFKFRIMAAYQLFKAEKIHYLLLSGDNHIKEYNEPTDMKEALLALDIPDSCIILDYAGFRTLDSVVRCKEVFGEDYNYYITKIS